MSVVGCGVGATAVTVAQRFGAHVTAVDIERLMLVKSDSDGCEIR
jgi:cyclopropane fatty-acyl-phospholipid synthase-like methyltransferase